MEAILKRLSVVIINALLISSVSYGAFSKNDSGTSAAQFLKLGAGAKVTAMGDAGAAISGDSSAIYWNPAGLNDVTGKSASVMHAIWFEDIAYDWASFAMPYKDWGVFGLAVQNLSYGSIKKIDSTGLETGDFSPSDICVSLSYGRELKGIKLGVNVKYISLKVVNSACAYAADLGAQHNVKNMLNDKLTLGFALQNIGTKIKFINEEDPLPMNIKLGGAYAIKDNWLAVLDLNAPVDNAVTIGAGTEYMCKVKEKIELFGRAGYNTRNLETGGLNGITAGFGVSYLDYTLDYAFVPYGELGNTQRISFSLKF